ncbi:MAG TPA: ribulose-phosphate 3-epimerase, partial [Pusillimonas sp.]|nr:ribulose-phosphate 3-epimerase [Pusillimonas sp.]
GSAIFGQSDYKQVIQAMRNEITKGETSTESTQP